MIGFMDGIKEKSLRLSEAMNLYGKKFEHGVLNLLNAPPASGKTTFITKDFLYDTTKYIKGIAENKKLSYDKRLSKILYICDTRMLMDSVMSDNNTIMTKFGKGSIIEAKNFSNLTKILSEDNGTIKVMSYSSLGYFMKKDKNSILNNFNIILADEIQNLFKYCKKHNYKINESGEKVFADKEYVNLIENLKNLTQKILFIGLSGTVNSIYQFQNQFGQFVKLKNIFTEEERKTLYTNNFEPQYTNCIFNRIKIINYNKVKESGYKIFIYTRTIKQSVKYKKWFELNGLNAEWLCSVNNKKKLISRDEEGNEVIEEIPVMNDYQLSIRDRLLNGTDEKRSNKGTVPDDLDVLIVNGAYETGWNLTDDRFQLCFCDTTDYEEQQQARHRIRHDIIGLWCLQRLYNEDGIILDYDQYGNSFEREKQIGVSTYMYEYVYEGRMKELGDKYIGIKLDKKLKDEIKFLYGIKGLNDKEVTWVTVKRDLIKLGYVIENSNGNGTYIFKKGYEIKRDSKRTVRKMENKNKANDLDTYLKNILGKKLFKDDQEELQNFISNDFKSMINRLTKGKGNCGYKVINKLLVTFNISYIIERPTERENGKYYWVVRNN